MAVKICNGPNCDAEIKLIKMTTGEWMPVEAESKKGIILVSGVLGKIVDVYEPHWGNCSDAKNFRRKNGHIIDWKK